MTTNHVLFVLFIVAAVVCLAANSFPTWAGKVALGLAFLALVVAFVPLH